MSSLRFAQRSLVAFVFVACGGSQKAPDTAAPEASNAAPAAAAESKAPEAEAPAKAKEAEPEAAPTGPECKKDDECTVFADCCTCKAVPASKPSPVPCESVCGESKCEVKGMTIANVACESGRCVLKKNK